MGSTEQEATRRAPRKQQAAPQGYYNSRLTPVQVQPRAPQVAVPNAYKTVDTISPAVLRPTSHALRTRIYPQAAGSRATSKAANRRSVIAIHQQRQAKETLVESEKQEEVRVKELELDEQEELEDEICESEHVGEQTVCVEIGRQSTQDSHEQPEEQPEEEEAEEEWELEAVAEAEESENSDTNESEEEPVRIEVPEAEVMQRPTTSAGATGQWQQSASRRPQTIVLPSASMLEDWVPIHFDTEWAPNGDQTLLLATEANATESATPLMHDRRPQTSAAEITPPQDSRRPQTSAATAVRSQMYQQTRRPLTSVETERQLISRPQASVAPAVHQPMQQQIRRPQTTRTVETPSSMSDSRRPQTTTAAIRQQTQRPQTSIEADAVPRQRPSTTMQRQHGVQYKEWRDIHVKSLSRVDSILREAAGLSRLQRSATTRTGGLGISVSPPVPTHKHTLAPLAVDAARQRPTTAMNRLPQSPFHTTSEHGSRPTTSAYSTHSSLSRSGSSRPSTHHSFAFSLFNEPSAVGAPVRRPSTRNYLLSRDDAHRSRLFAEYESLMGSDDEDGSGEPQALGAIAEDPVQAERRWTRMLHENQHLFTPAELPVLDTVADRPPAPVELPTLDIAPTAFSDAVKLALPEIVPGSSSPRLSPVHSESEQDPELTRPAESNDNPVEDLFSGTMFAAPVAAPVPSTPESADGFSDAQEQLDTAMGTMGGAELGTFLAGSGRQRILDAYMQRLAFADRPIDFALRHLLRHLHLPREAQQIDRVMTAFAARYHACNPSLFGSADTVYAYAFALLLLHTDAHNPKVRTKITRAQFVARARLMDDDGEIFDQVLEILYDNVTAARFEYAPGADPHPPDADGTSGFGKWFKRMFSPACPPDATRPISPADLPSKQYSYTPGDQPTSHSTSHSADLPPSPLAMALDASHDDLSLPRPMAVESIRLSSLKSHVKRRTSLRHGRPVSGIIDSPTRSSASLSPPTTALLRVDMAGRVFRKMDRLGNGRRGLVRWWKEIWMVLSGSRLYFFRLGDADNSAPLAIQTVIPLRHGVAVVDRAYIKYPHVFRILAGDGSQILVKAPGDDSVAEWMAHINCAAAFKTMEVERRADHDSPADRIQLLESRLGKLDQKLEDLDQKLARSLRLFKQLAVLVPLTKNARARAVQHSRAVREALKDLYLAEQRLTCYRDVLALDLDVEYEISANS